MTPTPHTISTADLPRLLLLLDQQRDLYEQLGILSQKQSELIEEGRTDSLLSLLNQRQTYIEALGQLNGQLEPFRLAWIQWLPMLSDQDRAAINVAIGKITTLRNAIAKQDDADAAHLHQAKGRLAGELGRMSRAGQAARRYRGGEGAGVALARYTDQQV